MIYVDKTDIIVDLIENSNFVFLTRPRRFGKSLLVSTMADLFQNGIEHFRGLKAENLWKEKRFRVIRLDFSLLKECQDVDGFERRLKWLLRDAAQNSGLQLPKDDFEDPARWWVNFLGMQDYSSMVLLIDEYDAPLTANLHQPVLFESIKGVLSSFFAATKSESGKLRFLFLTGIMKFRQASLFSSFNNISDISLRPEFGEIVGYTEKELGLYFGDYLSYAAQLLGVSCADLVEQMRSHYDGYCFDKSCRTHVYAPWSVLSFFRHPEDGLAHYWFESAGAPAILVNYLKTHKMLKPETFDAPVSLQLSSLSSAEHVSQIDPNVLLTHAGYLTIKQVSGQFVDLGYPNEEVRDAMAQLYCTAFWPNLNSNRNLSFDLLKAMDSFDESFLMTSLNGIIHHLDYQNFSLTSEAAVRQVVQVFCLGAGMNARIEVHSPLGRSDLELYLDAVNVVFEFKVVKHIGEADTALAKAIEQLIDRDYGNKEINKKMLRAALVFSVDRRSFVKIKIV